MGTGMKVLVGLLLLLVGGIGGYWFGRCCAVRSVVCGPPAAQSTPAAVSQPANPTK